jgi:hypothetical protein
MLGDDGIFGCDELAIQPCTGVNNCVIVSDCEDDVNYRTGDGGDNEDKEEEAGAELCQAQVKLGSAKEAEARKKLRALLILDLRTHSVQKEVEVVFAKY